MHNTILSHQTTTFFPNREAARKVAQANGGEAEGFIISPATGRPGKFIVQVFDDDGVTLLGTL
jgi:hypothetical protein